MVGHTDLLIEGMKEEIGKIEVKIAELQENVHRLMRNIDDGKKANEAQKSKKKAHSKYVCKKFEQIYGEKVYKNTLYPCKLLVSREA